MTRIHPLAPVVAIDIDGTLGAYHDHFTWFAELYLQSSLSPVYRNSDEGEFSNALDLDKRVYRDIKLAYRQGGMKRSMPVFKNARKSIEAIRADNIAVWITTTRPWNRLDNIDPDTQFWINRNIGKVDGVVYGEDKYLDLIDIVGRERILGVVDDIPENVDRASSLGLRRVLMDGPHNLWYKGRAPRIQSAVEIYNVVSKYWIDGKEYQP
jgi:hypothetical protein